LNEGIIREEELRKNDITKFKFFYLINSMLEIDDENKISIEKILN